MVVCRASPLKNEVPRAGAWGGASVDCSAGVEEGGAEEPVSCVSEVAVGTGGTAAASTALGGGGVLTGGVALALVEAVGVGLGWQ